MTACPNCKKSISWFDGDNNIVWLYFLYGIVPIPRCLGDLLWKMLCALPIKPYKKYNIVVEMLRCPFCKYTESFRSWVNREEIEEYERYLAGL